MTKRHYLSSTDILKLKLNSWVFDLFRQWALIFGAGLGGNFTPIGSASTVVAIAILKKEGHKVTFMQYVKIGAVVVLVQLTLASAYLFAADKAGIIPKMSGKPTTSVQESNGH